MRIYSAVASVANNIAILRFDFIPRRNYAIAADLRRGSQGVHVARQRCAGVPDRYGCSHCAQRHV